MNYADDIKNLAGNHTVASRIPFLRALQESIELRFKKLAQCAIQGLTCTSSDGAKTLFLILLKSFVEDISECEDMHSVKRGTQTATPCHNCVVAKDIFSVNRKEK